jgi:transposase
MTKTRAKTTQVQRTSIRIFSEELKKKLVEDIEFKRISIREVVNLYKVSDTAVRKWLNKYSLNKKRSTRVVLESASTESKIMVLLDRIAQLEQSLGKKQLELEFLHKVVDLCSEELGYDIKKKSSTMLLNTSGHATTRVQTL